MDMLKCKWGDLVQNRDSLLPGMILFIILKTKTKKHIISVLKLLPLKLTSFTVELM